MRAAVLRARAPRPRTRRERCASAIPPSSARSSSTSATPTAWRGSSPSTRDAIELVIHTAAQPSHDWAASDPQTDFACQRRRHAQPARGARATHAPGATFVFCSTNKVYGDLPNQLPLVELPQASGAARGSSLLRRHRHDDVDRPEHAFAVRGLEGVRRPARAGVRPLLRACPPSASGEAA